MINDNLYNVTYMNVHGEHQGDRLFQGSSVEIVLDHAWGKVDNEEDFPASIANEAGDVIWVNPRAKECITG